MSYVYPYGDRLPENGSIGRGYGLQSTNKRVVFHITSDGQLELLGDGKKLWSFNGKYASWVIMQTDGNCVAYTADHKAVWATATNGSIHPYTLVCQDDGNLVVYDSGKPVWATNTGGLVR